MLVFSFSFRKITESVSKLSARLDCGFSSNFDFVNTNSIFFLFLSYFRKLGILVKLLIFGFAKWSRRSKSLRFLFLFDFAL